MVEAQRLADELEDMACLWSPSVNRARVDKAAAELRRLHQFSEDQIGRATAAEAALQMTKATHALKIAAVEAQRDALLEKIKAVIAAEQSEGAGRGGFVNTPPTREHQRRVAQAWQELHAAIKAVEETK